MDRHNTGRQKSHDSSRASHPKEDFSKYCRDILDFPKPGIVFKDISNLLKPGPVFKRAIDEVARQYVGTKIDSVVCIEARGFIIGSALAYCLGSGVVPVRKKGKLPWHVYRKSYSLEYGVDELEVHQDSVDPGQNVLIVDDLIATGGTVEAVVDMMKDMKANIIGAAFLVELEGLKGKDKLKNIPIFSLIKYS